MGTIASQITSLTSVYSTVYSGADQSKHQSSASLAFVWGIHRGPVNSPHKWPVTRKMFPFDDVIMRYQLTHYLMYSNYLYMREIAQNAALFMMMSSNGNIFRVTVYLCGEFTGHKGQWRGALMFPLTCAWINGWVNNREAGVLRYHRAHYDITALFASYLNISILGEPTKTRGRYHGVFCNIGYWSETYSTHWGRVTHICVGNLTIIGSDNGLSPIRRQAIIWTNAGILSIGHLGTNFSEILIEIHTFSFKKMHLKRSSGKWRPFCLGFNVLLSWNLSKSTSVFESFWKYHRRESYIACTWQIPVTCILVFISVNSTTSNHTLIMKWYTKAMMNWDRQIFHSERNVFEKWFWQKFDQNTFFSNISFNFW